MKTALTILVAAAASFLAQRWASSRSTPALAETPALAATRTELRTRIESQRAQSRLLGQEIARLGGASAPARLPAAGATDEEIAAALERWQAAHPAADEPEDANTAPGQRVRAQAFAVDFDVAALPMHELVPLLADHGLTDFERQQLFQELRDAGRIDEYVAAIEAAAAADPDDANLQVALGNAYLQKLFGVGPAEAGPWAMKSDAAFDRALEIDDENWGARFTKAVSLSNWPAFLGRGPEAIENFEILLQQQSGQGLRPEFAMTYLFLGNMYQASGEPAQALRTWKEGLELFPEEDDLRRAIELAEESE